MKRKISITIEEDIIEKIEIDMERHRMRNKSKFIEMVLRSTLFDLRKRLYLLEKTRDRKLSEFKVLNEDILKLQDAAKLLDEADALQKPTEHLNIKETSNNAWD